MRILFTIPNEHYIHKSVMTAAIAILKSKIHHVELRLPSHKPYEHNMNRIAKNFIREKFDFWLNMDSDNAPVKNPLELIVHDKQVIGCPTPVWYYIPGKLERPFYFNAYDKDDKTGDYREHVPREKLQKVDAIGSGCMLVRRDALTGIKKPFDRRTDENGIVTRGPDLYFCEQVKERGGEIYAHYDYPCSHYNNINLFDMALSFSKAG